MKLSIIIPAHNEEGSIQDIVDKLVPEFAAAEIACEVLIVNDNSTDSTETVLKKLTDKYDSVRYINNSPPNGFGLAVRVGLESFSGDAAVIVMADGSDAPADVVRFYRKMQDGYDCVFGTRFSAGGTTYDYPLLKLILNRLTNWFIRLLFGFKYDDTTNAFKMYRRETIEGLKPFLSHHFNLTVELPLKAITRGYSYAVLPNSWKNRTAGEAKLKIKEMGSRYLFIVLYCLIERWLSLGDYKKE